MKPFVRSAFNYDTDKVSDETGLSCGEPSLAHQSFAEEVDINTIIRRFGLNGELPTGLVPPTYATFDGVHDFKSAMDAIAQANEAFDAMPAEVRSRFHNDPQEFVVFCSQEANREEAMKLKLVLPKAVELAAKPIRVEVIPPESALPGGAPK